MEKQEFDLKNFLDGLTEFPTIYAGRLNFSGSGYYLKTLVAGVDNPKTSTTFILYGDYGEMDEGRDFSEIFSLRNETLYLFKTTLFKEIREKITSLRSMEVFDENTIQKIFEKETENLTEWLKSQEKLEWILKLDRTYSRDRYFGEEEYYAHKDGLRMGTSIPSIEAIPICAELDPRKRKKHYDSLTPYFEKVRTLLNRI